MEGTDDIPDYSDWLDTPLNGVANLENALHCQICKEFYDTPMITTCSHTFCSKCIRTSLSADGRCPACRAPDQASKLRNNWALQEVVAAFLNARPAALKVARREQEEDARVKRSAKRKRVVLDSDDVAEEQNGRTTRSKSRRLAASQSSEPEIPEVDDSEADGESGPEPGDGLVECPLGCGRRMKIEAVEPHLDQCEDERRQEKRTSSRTRVNGVGSSRPSSGQDARPQERLAELNYSLLKDSAMRKKLEELGIPGWGSKQLIVRRHIEWVNLWNANCDSNQPRSKREVLQDLDTWERTQGGRAPNSQAPVNGVMKKDFDAARWANRNKDDFSRLIADAKRKKADPTPASTTLKEDHIREELTKPATSGGTDGNPCRSPSSQQQPGWSSSTNAAQPYADHPEALQSIREKVEAVNAGEHIEPALNAGFASSEQERALTCDASGQPTFSDIPKASSHAPRPENAALLEQVHFGKERVQSRDQYSVHEKTGSPCDLPAHLQRTSPKKVPMFAIPQEPISDIDGGGSGTAVQ